MNRRWLAGLLAAVVIVSVIPAASSSPLDDGVDDELTWFAGDWHVHTVASHDACAPQNADGFVDDPEDGCGDGPRSRPTARPACARPRPAVRTT